MKNPFICPDFDSDKIRVGLMEEYKKILGPMVYKPLSLLEIGIKRGGSILFWDDYLKSPDSRIVGIDLHIPDVSCTDRVALVQCDQNDSAALRSLGEKYGPFDIVIDDGSHQKNETRNCFEVLLPFVSTGGYYVIEDWTVGYCSDQFPQYEGMVELISDIMRNAPELNIRSMNIMWQPYKAMAFFQKGEGLTQ